jgi:mono/diheme cytochrome c family protein
MRTFVKGLAAGALVFAILQLVRPGIPAKPATAEIQAPDEAKQILQKDCYSCHSDERRLSWFDEIEPGYWLVRQDVLTARTRLNFSTLGAKPAGAQKAALYEAVNMIQLGAMPPPRFTALHPEAKVSAEELATLKAYLAPWPAYPGEHAANGNATGPQGAGTVHSIHQVLASFGAVRPEGNGLAFDPDFEGWKLISTTERGDNNTFRFILGNDVAVRAVQSGQISSWPDGARLAKIAWERIKSPDGFLYPGKFVQVELMVKDSRAYKKTDGWGWGRWRGLGLQPYGTGDAFVKECTGCHEPLRGNDYVYTLPITAVTVTRAEVANIRAAALLSSLPWQPLGWGPITMMADPDTLETATLFGNAAAMQAVRTVARGSGQQMVYPAGAVLALVTWGQRQDPHWFGARIPDVPHSVEFVLVGANGHPARYRKFAGSGLTEIAGDQTAAAKRSTYILGLAPAQLP